MFRSGYKPGGHEQALGHGRVEVGELAEVSALPSRLKFTWVPTQHRLGLGGLGYSVFGFGGVFGDPAAVADALLQEMKSEAAGQPAGGISTVSERCLVQEL